MPVSIRCGACNAKSKIPDELYVSRFAGQRSRIRCKKCGEQIEVDGSLDLNTADPASLEVLAVKVTPLRVQSATSLRAVAIPTSEAADESDAETLPKIEAEPVREAVPEATAEPEQNAAPVTPQAIISERVSAMGGQPELRGRRSFAMYGMIFAAATATGIALSSAASGRAQRVEPRLAAAHSPTLAHQVPAPSVPQREASVDGAPKTLPAAVATQSPGEPALRTVAKYDERALQRALRWFSEQADACHRGGRAGGTAKLVVTFGPAGKVTAAHIEGEPIASAPVARCILSHGRSMILPRFEGESFTVTREFTLR